MQSIKDIVFTQNQKKLLNIIYSCKEATRQDLVNRSCFSVLTVNRFVSYFLETGIVIESGTMQSTGGRKPVTLSINPDYAVILCVDIGTSSVRIGALSITGDILEKYEQSYYAAVVPVTVMQPDELIERLKVFYEKYGAERVLGIGVGISGLVDSLRHSIVFCPNFHGYDNLPLVSMLEEHFDVPVFLNTSARCMALCEQRFGIGEGCPDMTFVTIGYSISAGIITNGELFTGASGFSGEIGHLQAWDNKVQCTCGNYGCLETHVALPVIIERIRELLKSPNIFSIAKNLAPALEGIDISVIQNALKSGDKVIYQFMTEIGGDIGRVLTSLINIMNPGLLVLGGSVIECFPELIDEICRTIRKNTLITNQRDLVIKKSSIGFDGGLRGSGTQVINHFLN